MEVYLNIAETGIATYGVNAGAQRYFNKDASELSRSEAARIAAVLPLPKQREVVTPSGFTRRYGNSIAARIAVVQRDRLDTCVYGSAETPAPVERDEPVRRERPKAKIEAPVAPVVEPGAEYEKQAPAGEPEPEPAPAPAPEPEPEPKPAPEQPEVNGA